MPGPRQHLGPAAAAAFVLAILALGAGCTEKLDLNNPPGPLPPPNPMDTLLVTPDSVQTIFTATCALSGCHAGASPQSGQNLEAAESYAEIVNVPSEEMPTLFRVEPGDTLDSYLIMKIKGDPRISGFRMPLGAAPLDPAQVRTIVLWTLAGAPAESVFVPLGPAARVALP